MGIKERFYLGNRRVIKKKVWKYIFRFKKLLYF